MPPIHYELLNYCHISQVKNTEFCTSHLWTDYWHCQWQLLTRVKTTYCHISTAVITIPTCG